MSCIRCERCDTNIDSDFDPECFVEVPWLNMAEKVWCEPCRDAEWAENEASAPTTIPLHTTEQVGGHTPTPWKVDPRYCDDIIGGDGRDVAETLLSAEYMRPADERRANAEFIVRAANNHDGLVAALREVAILGHGKCTIGKPLADMIRAALAKATGGAS